MEQQLISIFNQNPKHYTEMAIQANASGKILSVENGELILIDQPEIIEPEITVE